MPQFKVNLFEKSLFDYYSPDSFFPGSFEEQKAAFELLKKGRRVSKSSEDSGVMLINSTVVSPTSSDKATISKYSSGEY